MTSVQTNPESVNPDVQAMIDQALAMADQERMARLQADREPAYLPLGTDATECNGRTWLSCHTHGCNDERCGLLAANIPCTLPHRITEATA